MLELERWHDENVLDLGNVKSISGRNRCADMIMNENWIWSERELCPMQENARSHDENELDLEGYVKCISCRSWCASIKSASERGTKLFLVQ